MRIGIWGICGKMGKALCKTIKETDNDFQIVFGVDQKLKDMKTDNINYYKDGSKIKENVDMIIDFSNHNSTSELLTLAKKLHSPLLICTTGQTCSELMEIGYTSKRIPIMVTPNTSIGSAFLINMAKSGAKYLEAKFEIDISETHSINKKDTPSGTAMAILQAILSVCPNLTPIYTWTEHDSRKKNQVIVTSKRIEDKIGEHEISFTNTDELITIKHEVLNRNVFALGALECAKFLVNKPAGLYRMEDMLKNEKNKINKNKSNFEHQK